MKRVIKHRLFNKATALCMILLIVWGCLIYNGLGGLAGLLFSSDWPGYLLCALLGLVILAIHRRWFYPEFEGCLRGGHIGKGFKLGIPFFIYISIFAILTPLLGKFGAPSITTVSMALMAGFGEEAAFRGLPLSYAMRQWRSRGSKFIMLSAVISAVCFGGIHLVNLGGGASVTMTLAQILGTMGMGFLLSAIFLRTGNLWVPIILHTVNDIVAFCDVSLVGEDGIMTAQALSVFNYIDIGLCVVLGIVGIYMLRPDKAEKIRQVWEKKWK